MEEEENKWRMAYLPAVVSGASNKDQSGTSVYICALLKHSCTFRAEHE